MEPEDSPPPHFPWSYHQIALPASRMAAQQLDRTPLHPLPGKDLDSSRSPFRSACPPPGPAPGRCWTEQPQRWAPRRLNSSKRNQTAGPERQMIAPRWCRIQYSHR